jgi:hypothetical protein
MHLTGSPGDSCVRSLPARLRRDRGDAEAALGSLGGRGHDVRGVVEESPVRIIDAFPVAGRQQVQEQTAHDGHAQTGLGSGRRSIEAGTDIGVGDRSYP